MMIAFSTMNDNNDVFIITQFTIPFVVSLSNHERPFDRLRANGLNPIFKAM
jgi:hypothetical protein